MSDINDILERASTNGLTITTAESCTGGLIAGALTDLSGSSAIFERGFVTYSNQAKVEMLGVAAETLDKQGAVSEEVAHEMATGARQNAKADIALSVTGIAGPGGSEFKPEGRVCFAISSNALSLVETVEFGAIGRTNVRAAAVTHGLKLILQAVNSK